MLKEKEELKQQLKDHRNKNKSIFVYNDGSWRIVGNGIVNRTNLHSITQIEPLHTLQRQGFGVAKDTAILPRKIDLVVQNIDLRLPRNEVNPFGGVN